MKQFRIGIDFDNTIVCYDDVFYKAALEQKLIPVHLSASKTKIRDYFRAEGKEDEWTQLQGYVYGARMDLAAPYPGIGSFLSFCKEKGIQVSIISHKTKHPYLGFPYNLHQAARNWLQQQSFFHPEISLFFELTLKEKLNRIALEQCDYFIDDLPELLNEPSFPSSVQKILFDPQNLHPSNPKWMAINSWEYTTWIPKLFPPS